MRRIHLAAAAAASLAIASGASAQGLFDFDPAEDGLYLSGFVGFGQQGDADFSGVQAPEAGVPGAAGAPANISLDYDGDVFFGGAVGYQLPFRYWTYFHPRLELEVSAFSQSDISGGSFNGGNQTFEGDQSLTFILLNNYSDIRWSDDQTIIPFVGGGIGVGRVDTNVRYGPPGAPAPTFALDDDSSGLAGTIAGGVTVKTSARSEIYGEARYYRIEGVEIERRFIGGGENLFSANVEDDLDGAALRVGARIRF